MAGTKAGNRVVGDNGREGGCGGGGKFQNGLEDIGGVGSRSSKVLVNHVFELFESSRLDVEFPIKVLAYLALHLIDLSELKHILADD